MTPSPADLDLRVDRGSELPVGAQLTRKLRSLVTGGRLPPGERLPSIRELAAAAGVNVNTVRSVYARLEREGLIQTEHGRGSFVRGPAGEDGPQPGEGSRRRQLRREIAALEAELLRRPRLAAALPELPGGASGSGARARGTDELAAVRDELLQRLRELEAARAEVVQRLEELDSAEELDGAETEVAPQPRRHSTPSLTGARVRWVGGA